MTTQTMNPNTTVAYTVDQVIAAMNKAYIDIDDAADLGDEGARDALNLIINATIDYLTGKSDNLSDVAENNYSLDDEVVDGSALDTIIGWINS